MISKVTEEMLSFPQFKPFQDLIELVRFNGGKVKLILDRGFRDLEKWLRDPTKREERPK
jgi:hypothetical protein